MSSMFGPNRYARGARDDTGWTALTLSNSWVNFGGAHPAAEYRVYGGVVYIRGVIKDGTITAGTVITTLPAGARPAFTLVHSIPINPGSAVARVDISGSGVVTAMTTLASWVALTFVPFLAEQ